MPPRDPSNERPLLLVIAAPLEAQAVLSRIDDATGRGDGNVQVPPLWQPVPATPRLHVVLSGLGKANAAAATATFLNPELHRAALSVGVAGALPGSGLEPGAVVLASRCVFADEGVETPDGFETAEHMGFPPAIDAQGIDCASGLVARLAPIADATGAIATVSTCSGTDARARAIAERTGALAEAMEGAAVVTAAARLGVPAGELRIISNTTGDRTTQRWDLAVALERLADLATRL